MRKSRSQETQLWLSITPGASLRKGHSSFLGHSPSKVKAKGTNQGSPNTTVWPVQRPALLSHQFLEASSQSLPYDGSSMVPCFGHRMGTTHLSSQATPWLWELFLLLLSILGTSGGSASQTDRLGDGTKEVVRRGRGSGLSV